MVGVNLPRPVLRANVGIHVSGCTVVEVIVHHVEDFVAGLSLEEDVEVEVAVAELQWNTKHEVGKRRAEECAVF